MIGRSVLLIPGCERNHRAHEVVEVKPFVLWIQARSRMVEVLARLLIQLEACWLISHDCKCLVYEGKACFSLQNTRLVLILLHVEITKCVFLVIFEARVVHKL